jgi:hypothetical protein
VWAKLPTAMRVRVLKKTKQALMENIIFINTQKYIVDTFTQVMFFHALKIGLTMFLNIKSQKFLHQQL